MAFAELLEGLLEKLLLEENRDLLVRIVAHHVVSGTVLVADVTVGGVTVNGENVILADVLASNGVIHVIDTVILLPDVKISTF